MITLNVFCLAVVWLSGLRWELVRHHDGDHKYPYELEEDGTILSPPPEDLLCTNPEGNYLEVRLIATASEELSKTAVWELRPKTVEIGFGTRLTNLMLKINGEALRDPATLLSWEGYELNVFAPR